MAHTAKILLKSLLLVVFTAFSGRPMPALAFEAGLPSAAAQKLVATVQLAASAPGFGEPLVEYEYEDAFDNFIEPLPAYSHRSSGIVTAYPTVVTAPSERRPPSRRRLALAARSLTLPLTLEGEASYYSRDGCLGCSASLTMANGQPLDDEALTMAIGANQNHLVGHAATVTNLSTGKSVKVLITDTGGFYQERYGNRVADLTIGTKNAIGMKGGLGQVRIDVH
ncbi:MAG: hypothetical protein HY372_03710 [Candidatus Andersenbacteria bacterium]|nr:hypothetical protein [Candidatus Andersenbacteria bacterium]